MTLEKYMKNELEEELPEELRNVSTNKYSYLCACFCLILVWFVSWINLFL